jgi:hypothetical protein
MRGMVIVRSKYERGMKKKQLWMLKEYLKVYNERNYFVVQMVIGFEIL